MKCVVHEVCSDLAGTKKKPGFSEEAGLLGHEERKPMSKAPNDKQGNARWPFVSQFRLIHLFYAIALVGSTLGTFGSEAIVLAAVILAFWTYVFSRRSRPRGLLEACILLPLLFCLLTMHLPVDRHSRRRSSCNNNLKNVALALQAYHDVYGEFPPAYIADENGKPMHSWRVLILPYLENRNLYDKYRFDEPWDGPRNRQLLHKIWGDYFVCPSDPRAADGQRKWTSYVAVVGPRTVWPGARSRKMSEIPDGTSNAVMVIEDQSDQIAWMEPRDLEFDEALRRFTSSDPQPVGLHRSEDFFFEYYKGRHVACVDGSVHFVYCGVKPDVWSALLIIDEGKKRSELDLRGSGHGIRRVKLGNWFRLTIFVLLVVLPLPWVWLRKRPAAP